ncbi:helix-turn-helix transcriptional regulator [Bacillaceae bacterium SIJ1]|uniref:helix-turn-helix domain-containing protein n=1 Tax=Litoribacterium kuwaitense TaxID=1398745 RepID=UPI0013EC9146|nr:helix-turn-helix transcriptional regulator [Litoribacterium kuwaitense]NGP46015.1 helix-turn-helix transcriptional regulator [Litoribacterium kuwaitense]
MKMHERIRSYIEASGLKLNFVAEKSGINPKRFYRLINGQSPLSIEEYEAICHGLSVDAGYFFKNKFLETKNEQKVI